MERALNKLLEIVKTHEDRLTQLTHRLAQVSGHVTTAHEQNVNMMAKLATLQIVLFEVLKDAALDRRARVDRLRERVARGQFPQAMAQELEPFLRVIEGQQAETWPLVMPPVSE